jgi:SAM-dependent methyltransferase
MTDRGFIFRDSCRLCESRDLEMVVSLTPTPPGNHFLRADEVGQVEPVYPLELHFCRACAHVQLGHVVDPRILYQENYTYVSGTSPVFVDHLRNYAAEVIQRFALPKGELVVDIGSNDGTCLGFFQQAGFRVLGVDPATDIARRATESGIETVDEFFSLSVAERLRDQFGPATMITSHNTCAHIDDLIGVVEGVRHWLAEDGLFVLEVGYLLDVCQNIWFDTIYHEHVDYHSFAPLERFFRRLDMQVVDVQRIEPQGGSIRVVVKKASGSRPIASSVQELIELEKELGLDEPETFRVFEGQINKTRDECVSLVLGLLKEGKSIAGYGAPTKATTLLTHFKLGGGVLDFIVDDNPLKQGLFSPLHHVPVVAVDEIYRRRPDFVVVLAWNFAESIMERHSKYVAEGGRFIIPMPEARIVD